MQTFRNESELATEAANLSYKPKKAKLQELVVNLATGKELDGTELAALYNHFMPATQSKPKTSFDWVYKACEKKGVREYLKYVYATGNTLVGTDGHRMHVLYDLDGLESGDVHYNKNRVKVELSGRFPNWQRVFPSETSCHQVDFNHFKDNLNVIKLEQKRPFDLAYEYEFDLPDGKVGTFHGCKKYIDEALAGFDHCEVFIGNDFSKIVFQSVMKSAIVMYLKV